MRENKYLDNFIWRFLERWAARGVSLVVALVLARLLAPQVYGTVAIITVITSFLSIFVDAGFSGALIQKKDADELDFSTVFYFNIVICVVLYGGLFAAAPLIANFYKIPMLTPLVRVQGLGLLISGVKSIQVTYITKKLQFRKFFFATLGGTVGAAVVGIWMAYHGFGVWALVAQDLFNNLVDTIILLITIQWRPKRMFSWDRLKALYSFGWKLSLSSVSYYFYVDLRQLLIGKIYTTEDLAFFNKGQEIPRFIGTNINSALDSVLFPAMSENQNDTVRLKAMTRRTIMTSAFVVSPLTTGLAVCAVPLVRLVLTEKWLPCVEYLRIFSIPFLFGYIGNANFDVLKALGKGKDYLSNEIIKDILDILIVLATIHLGVRGMAYGNIISGILIQQWICCRKSEEYIDYSYWQQLCDIFPNILLTLFMGACVWCVTLFGLPDLITLLIQVPLGAAIYIGLAYLLRFESLQYVWSNMRPYMMRVKRNKNI